MGGRRGLMRAALNAAHRDWRSVDASQTGRSAPPDPLGQAIWRVAERRAATLYRRAAGTIYASAIRTITSSTKQRPSRNAFSCRKEGPGRPAAGRRTGFRSTSAPDSTHRSEWTSATCGSTTIRRRPHRRARLRAHAFAHGNDIYFAKGAYDPTTVAGQELIAHETAHPLQQRVAAISSGARWEISRPGDAFEAEADRAAARMVRGEPTAVHARADATSIHRSPDHPVTFDLEVLTPEAREQLRAQGIELSQVSAQAADPRRHSDYVDTRLEAVGYGITLGGFLVYCRGLEYPVLVPETYLDLQMTQGQPTDLAIFPDRESAMRTVPYGPFAPGQPRPYGGR